MEQQHVLASIGKYVHDTFADIPIHASRNPEYIPKNDNERLQPYFGVGLARGVTKQVSTGIYVDTDRWVIVYLGKDENDTRSKLYRLRSRLVGDKRIIGYLYNFEFQIPVIYLPRIGTWKSIPFANDPDINKGDVLFTDATVQFSNINRDGDDVTTIINNILSIGTKINIYDRKQEMLAASFTISVDANISSDPDNQFNLLIDWDPKYPRSNLRDGTIYEFIQDKPELESLAFTGVSNGVESHITSIGINREDARNIYTLPENIINPPIIGDQQPTNVAMIQFPKVPKASSIFDHYNVYKDTGEIDDDGDTIYKLIDDFIHPENSRNTNLQVRLASFDETETQYMKSNELIPFSYMQIMNIFSEISENPIEDGLWKGVLVLDIDSKVLTVDDNYPLISKLKIRVEATNDGRKYEPIPKGVIS